MNRLKSIAILLLFALLTGFFIWAVFSPKNNIQQIIADKLKTEEEKSDVAFELVTFSETEGGIKYWKLNAVSSTVNKTTGIAHLKTVDGLFFKNGKPALKFIAPKALWNLKKKEIYLIEPIGYDIKFEKEIKGKIKELGGIQRLVSSFSLASEKPASKSKGYWFKAKNLDWKLSTKKLTCKGGIVLTKGDITIRSKNLEADAAFEKVNLTGSPHAVLCPERDKSEINIKADSFLVDSQIDKIHANDNVTIKRKSTILTSLNAIYDQKDKNINLLENVHLATRKVEAWSDEAMYSVSDYIAELSGNARAKRDKSELRGEKIIVLTEEGKIFVIGRTKVKIQESETEQ